VAITIRQIRDDIINPDMRLSDILRKAKVLAYRMDLPDFKEWVDYELDGYYGQNAELPDYRVAKAHNLGEFSGFAGAHISNAPIPTRSLPEWVREQVSDIMMRDSVAQLESMARGSEEMHHVPWPADLVAMVGDVGQIVQGYALVAAQQPIPRNAVEGILDAVRNRLLAFVLELETQFPEKAESEEAAGEIPADRSAQIFQTHVYGGQNVIASGHDITQQTVFTPPDLLAGDLGALLDYVRELGVSEEDVVDLKKVVEEEALSEPGQLGPQSEGWLGRLATKGIEGATTATVGQVVQYAAKAIAQYYGFDPGT
jgi:hypothetical protein